MGLGGGDLNLLVALKALLEEVNVTRAGDRLGMSQPAMSTALSRLRRQYSDELLVRVGRDYELTPLARALRPQVQEALTLVERAFLLDQDFDYSTSGRSFRIALSDYVLMVISPIVRAALTQMAPNVVLRYSPIPPDMHERELRILDFDCMVGPRGFGFQGESVDVFQDRFVCVVDPANPRLRAGRLTMDDIRELPHVRGVLGSSPPTPVDRRLAELGIDRRIEITARGWLPLAFLVRGTTMVAIIPERLANRVAASAGVAIVEPPFGHLPLHEALWWHPTRASDRGNRWLIALIQDVTRTLQQPPGVPQQ